MTTRAIPIREYSSIDAPTEIDLRDLEGYLDRKINGERLNALEVSVASAKITANFHVGVVVYKGFCFQILPKLISDDEFDNLVEARPKIIKNLIFMLSYTRRLKIKTNEEADLARTKNPFLEILIREYARSLFDCLKRITPRNYIREEDNLRFLKGKLKINENIKFNSADKSRFYCEYDEFSEDNELNRLFLFVSSCLHEISNDSKNKNLLKFITNYFSEIKLVKFDQLRVNKIRLARAQEIFRKPFNLAKMFVEQASVDLSQNKFRNVTLVWDMNQLFEEFVFEVMNRNESDLNGWKVRAQFELPLLISKEKGAKVDILAEKGKGERIVIDTKYKRIKRIKDIDDSDIHQVSTYCLLYGASKAVLLYPLWQGENLDITDDLNIHPQIAENTKIKIEFKTIDLKYEDLSKSLERKVKPQIVEIFSPEKNTNNSQDIEVAS